MSDDCAPCLAPACDCCRSWTPLAESLEAEIERLRAERDLLVGFFTENRAALSQVNSTGDARVSFLGPMEILAEFAPVFRELLAAKEADR